MKICYEVKRKEFYSALLPTPSTDHLKAKEYEDVYEPAEDTFILLDALEADIKRLAGSTLCIEIGSGSGCVSAFLGQIIGVNSCLYISTDLNPFATHCTLLTGQHNSVPLQPIQTDLLTSLIPRINHSVDVLVFNPPYVETEEEEMISAQEVGIIERSWAGGKEGMGVTGRVLDIVEDLLSDRGVFYLVAIAQNKPLEIIEQMKTKGLLGEIILKRRAGGEHLHVLRFSRP